MGKRPGPSAGNESGISAGGRLLLWSGVVRRFLLYLFNRKYVGESSAKRRGECLRCGACCRLVVNPCPYLVFDGDGKSSCVKYDSTRMPNCVIFQIDRRDIRERDLVCQIPCGYGFD